MITFRSFMEDDIGAGLMLSRAAGWNQGHDDWRTLLNSDEHHAIAAVDENGLVVGCVTIVGFDHTFAWIGMLLVHPNYRRMGLGSSLLNEAIQHIGPTTTPRLDATPDGRAVYLKLNFIDEFQLWRLQRPAYAGAITIDSLIRVRAMVQGDLKSIRAWDALVFGADRSKLLSSLFNIPSSRCFVAQSDEGIGGFCYSRSGHNFFYVGPMVARDIDVAKALLNKVIEASSGKPIAIDVTEFVPEWKSFLMSIGFTEQRPFFRMYMGDQPAEGHRHEMFAIAGPEFG